MEPNTNDVTTTNSDTKSPGSIKELQTNEITTFDIDSLSPSTINELQSLIGGDLVKLIAFNEKDQPTYFAQKGVMAMRKKKKCTCHTTIGGVEIYYPCLC